MVTPVTPPRPSYRISVKSFQAAFNCTFSTNGSSVARFGQISPPNLATLAAAQIGMPDWVGNGIHLSSQSQNSTVDGGIIPRAAKEEARADTNACIDGNPIIVVMAAHLALPR